MFSEGVCQETQGLHRFCAFVAAYGLDKYDQVSYIDDQLNGLLSVVTNNVEFSKPATVYDQFEFFWYVYAIAFQWQECNICDMTTSLLDRKIFTDNVRGVYLSEVYNMLGVDTSSDDFEKLILDMAEYLKQYNTYGTTSLITNTRYMLVGNHKDLNKQNNSVYNLELITNEENLIHYSILYTLSITRLCNEVCEIYEEECSDGVKHKIRFKPGFGIGIWDIKAFESKLKIELKDKVDITDGSVVNLLVSFGREMKKDVDKFIKYREAAEDRENGVDIPSDLKCLEVNCLHPTLLTELIRFLGTRYESYRRLCERTDIYNIWYDKRDSYFEAFSDNAFRYYKTKKIVEIRPTGGYTAADDHLLNDVFITNSEVHDEVLNSNAALLSNDFSLQSIDMDLLIEHYHKSASCNMAKIRYAKMTESLMNRFTEIRIKYIQNLEDRIFDKTIRVAYFKYIKKDDLRAIGRLIGNAASMYAYLEMFVDSYGNADVDIEESNIINSVMQKKFFTVDTEFNFTKDTDDDDLIITNNDVPALVISGFKSCSVHVTNPTKFNSFLGKGRDVKWDFNSKDRKNQECRQAILNMFCMIGKYLQMQSASIFAEYYGLSFSYDSIQREGYNNNYFVYDFVQNIDHRDQIRFLQCI